MIKLTALLTFVTDLPQDECDALIGMSDLTDAVVTTVLHGAAAGDLALHLFFASAAEWSSSGVARVERLAADPRVAGLEAIAYAPDPVRLAAPAIGSAVHRTLLLSIEPGTPAATEARFVADLRAMPGYIDEIRNAAIGRAIWSCGRQRWTHIWEQEFAVLAELTGAYMQHPYHWGYVDRWFDIEAPERIVRTDLCHSASAIAASVIARYA